jgi:hypothetical protein
MEAPDLEPGVLQVEVALGAVHDLVADLALVRSRPIRVAAPAFCHASWSMMIGRDPDRRSVIWYTALAIGTAS